MKIQVSKEARQDLKEISRYTKENHGIEADRKYREKINAKLDLLSRQPKAGPNRESVAKGLRSIVAEHHTLFYRVKEDIIQVVRILHTSRDITRQLQREQSEREKRERYRRDREEGRERER